MHGRATQELAEEVGRTYGRPTRELAEEAGRTHGRPSRELAMTWGVAPRATSPRIRSTNFGGWLHKCCKIACVDCPAKSLKSIPQKRLQSSASGRIGVHAMQHHVTGTVDGQNYAPLARAPPPGVPRLQCCVPTIAWAAGRVQMYAAASRISSMRCDQKLHNHL